MWNLKAFAHLMLISTKLEKKFILCLWFNGFLLNQVKKKMKKKADHDYVELPHDHISITFAINYNINGKTSSP